MREEIRDEDAIQTFISATTEKCVYRTLVSVAAESLSADICKVATVEGKALVPQTRSDGRPVDPDLHLSLNENIIGRSITAEKSVFVDDIQFTRSTVNAQESQNQTQIRAIFSVPISDYGALIGTASEPDVFDSSDREWVEKLVSYAEAALDRIHHAETGASMQDRFDKFGTIVTHDLRGPLAVARGCTEYCQENDDTGALDDALDALNRIDQIITDTYTLIHLDQKIGDPESVSLASLTSDCWGTIDTVDAILSINGNLTFDADRSQLRNLFENLFRNAIEHGGNRVKITVGSIDDGFYVEDTGSGIPSNHRESLFEPGFTTTAGGSGYGLAIVKQIVEAHGWTITVTEGHEGGARFEITGLQ